MHKKRNPPLLVLETFHTDWSYFFPGPTTNPIRLPLFRNSREAMLNCLLIRPLWHDRNCCVYAHIHTSICTSNLLVMRSVLSLELREKREDMKERRKRDERRGGQQRKSHVMFSQWRSECACACDRVCVSNWSHLHHLQDTFLYVLHVCDVILSRSRYEYSRAKARSYVCVIVLGCSFLKILFVC